MHGKILRSLEGRYSVAWGKKTKRMELRGENEKDRKSYKLWKEKGCIL